MRGSRRRAWPGTEYTCCAPDRRFADVVWRCCSRRSARIASGQGRSTEPSDALAAYVAGARRELRVARSAPLSSSRRRDHRAPSRVTDLAEPDLEAPASAREAATASATSATQCSSSAVGGGATNTRPPRTTRILPEDGELFVAIARLLRTPVVVLGQVPYQPLFDLTEDRLIAHTFERYLATGDVEWPLLLPMVNSVVRAFDASSAASEREWGSPLERFTVTGGSKRGWTTWLTAAVDTRVVALAPLVIDALNMEQHFPHQIEAWGAPSEEIRPYTDLGLDRILASPEGAALRQIVDPFSYRAQLAQPKLVVLATNDEYFPLDSANLYFGELREPKYLLYLPNEPHSVEEYEPFVRSLRALHEAASGGDPLPRLEWEYLASGGELTLCVRSEPAARRWRVWRAVSDDRDFRDAEWQPVAESPRSEARFVLREPAQRLCRDRRRSRLRSRSARFHAIDELERRGGRRTSGRTARNR